VEAERLKEECWKRYMERIEYFLKNLKANGVRAVHEKVMELELANKQLEERVEEVTGQKVRLQQ
jgi:hypothetical protein